MVYFEKKGSIFKRGGGGGGQLPSSMETYRTCDFPGGPDPCSCSGSMHVQLHWMYQHGHKRVLGICDRTKISRAGHICTVWDGVEIQALGLYNLFNVQLN